MRKLAYAALPVLLAGCDKAQVADSAISHEGAITGIVGAVGTALGQPWVLPILAGGFAVLKGWHKPALGAAGTVVGAAGDATQTVGNSLIGILTHIVAAFSGAAQHGEDLLKGFNTPPAPKA